MAIVLRRGDHWVLTISVSIPPSPLKWRTFGQVHSTRHEFLLVEKTSTLIQKWLITPITVMLTGTRLPWYVSIIAYRWAIPLKAFLLYWPTGYLLANRVKIFRTIPGWFSQIKFLFLFFLFLGGGAERGGDILVLQCHRLNPQWWGQHGSRGRKLSTILCCRREEEKTRDGAHHLPL